MKSSTTVIVENGASSIKAGLAEKDGEEPKIVTNAIVRSKGDKITYYGHEFERCQDHSSLHFRLPFEKGYLVDWDAQKAVWDGLFSSEVLGADTASSSLLITEPYFNLPNIEEVYDQFAFEEYEFQSYYRCTPAALIPHGNLYKEGSLPTPECMLVVDSGFSFTHIVPILQGSIVWDAVKRVDVGGKLLNNQLKELVSFRQWNMMDETYVMNNVKETCCYVATDYRRDMEICRTDPKANPIVQEYLLPDFSVNRKGRLRQADDVIGETDQLLYMNNERFCVPEIIFNPSDVGLQQMGLPSAIAHSISLLPEDLQALFWANIGLIGGNTKFTGFRDRLYSELRSLASVDCEVGIYTSNDPITEAYRSALSFARGPDFSAHAVTRTEYLEAGSNACRRKFRGWKTTEDKGAETPSKGKGRMRESDEDVSPAPRGRGRPRTLSTSTRRR